MAAIDDSLASPGFLKTNRDEGTPLTSEQRSQLIRRGNEFFNSKRYELAKRIFITTHYTDGLIRLGDHYYKSDQPLEAFRMYWLAPDHSKTEHLIERMADVIRSWLGEPHDD